MEYDYYTDEGIYCVQCGKSYIPGKWIHSASFCQECSEVNFNLVEVEEEIE